MHDSVIHLYVISFPSDALYQNKISNSDDCCVRCIGDLDIPSERRRQDDVIEFDAYGQKVIDKVKELGMHVFSYYGPQRRRIFSVIKVPIHVIQKFAIKRKFSMMLDPKILQEQCKKGFPDAGIAPIDINDDPQYSPISPYDYIYGRYTEKVDTQLYWRPRSLNSDEHEEKKYSEIRRFFTFNNLTSYLSLSAFNYHENIDIEPDTYYRSRDVDTPFRELIRLQLIGMLLESRTENGENSVLTMHKYIADGHIDACFCLHDRYKSAKIMDEWFDYKIYFTYFAYGRHMKYIKEYFGEKTCLYFITLYLFLHANVTCHLCVCAAGLYRVWCGLCRSMSLISKV